MLVKITNGVNIYEVTRGAFDTIYKHQGFRVYGATQETGVAVVGVEEVTEGDGEKSDDEIFLEAIVQKPLSQWKKDEVKRYAELKDIDITGTKSANEAKEIIQATLEV